MSAAQTISAQSSQEGDWKVWVGIAMALLAPFIGWFTKWILDTREVAALKAKEEAQAARVGVEKDVQTRLENYKESLETLAKAIGRCEKAVADVSLSVDTRDKFFLSKVHDLDLALKDRATRESLEDLKKQISDSFDKFRAEFREDMRRLEDKFPEKKG